MFGERDIASITVGGVGVQSHQTFPPKLLLETYSCCCARPLSHSCFATWHYHAYRGARIKGSIHLMMARHARALAHSVFITWRATAWLEPRMRAAEVFLVLNPMKREWPGSWGRHFQCRAAPRLQPPPPRLCLPLAAGAVAAAGVACWGLWLEGLTDC